MTLATTCPSCRTSFKVVPDQLKLRRGLVRCGKCQHVFSGIDFLTYVEPTGSRNPNDALATAATVRPPATPTRAPESTILAAAQARLLRPQTEATPAATSSSVTLPASATQAPPPVARSREAEDVGESTDPAVGAIDDLNTAFFIPDTGFGKEGLAQQNTAPAVPLSASSYSMSSPWTKPDPAHSASSRSESDGQVSRDVSPGDVDQVDVALSDRALGDRAPGDPDLSEVETAETITLATHTHASDTAHPSLTAPTESSPDAAREGPVWGTSDPLAESAPQSEASRWPAMIVAAALTLALVAQAVVGWRDEIAARLPAIAPTLSQLMAPFGWSVSAPRQRAALSIESFELRAGNAAGEFDVSAILSNRAAHPVALPALELTLTDSAGAVMLRKVLTAADYANPQPGMLDNLPGRAERTVRLRVALNGPAPAGYTADLFYP